VQVFEALQSKVWAFGHPVQFDERSQNDYIFLLYDITMDLRLILSL